MNANLRIASLVPSVTELLVALGLGPRLVARTGFCVHPAAALAAVPKVGGTKDVNLDKLRRLAPTHIVVNVDENRLETVQALRGWGVELVLTHPCSPEDVPGLIADLAARLARGEDAALVRSRAAALEAELQAELTATTPAGRPARSVLYLIWRDPWMTVARDTYISRLLARVNWHTLPALEGGERGAARYPVLEGRPAWLDEVREVLLSSEPYAFGPQHLAEAAALCPGARVRLVDGEALGWYGARTAPGLRYLRGLVG